jgi:hypothetical protein
MSLTSAPSEIATNVLFRLDARSVLRVARTCKHFYEIVQDPHLWHAMLIYRFGTGTLVSQDYVDLYRQKALMKHSIAKEFNIVWLNDMYWTQTQDETSDSGTVAQLNSVCWFDVRGMVKGVPNGTFKVVWNINIGRQASDLDQLEFGCSVNGNQLLSYRPHEEWFALLADSGWTTFTIPVPLVVDTGSFVDVECFIQDHSDSWKGGIALDYVRLIQQ